MKVHVAYPEAKTSQDEGNHDAYNPREGSIRTQDRFMTFKDPDEDCDNQKHTPINYHETGEAECKQVSTSVDSLKIMTYNVFFIWCSWTGKVPCEPDKRRRVRAQTLPKWFVDRDEDIVFFQEMFSYNTDIKNGMLEAGYCGQAVVPDKNEAYGSGLGIFTKFEILETKFVRLASLGSCDLVNPM